MYWMLHDCGVPAKHLVYSKVRRGVWVVADACCQVRGRGGCWSAAVPSPPLGPLMYTLILIATASPTPLVWRRRALLIL